MKKHILSNYLKQLLVFFLGLKGDRRGAEGPGDLRLAPTEEPARALRPRTRAIDGSQGNVTLASLHVTSRPVYMQGSLQKRRTSLRMSFFLARAIDGTRTRGLDLGKVALHQLSHYRIINIVPSQL